MNLCPPELHSYIVHLACHDDGSTARSLTRVSKYFNAVTAPYLFQSIVLIGMDNISRVCSILERTPAYARCVRHLYISDKPDLVFASLSVSDGAILMKLMTYTAQMLHTLAFVINSIPSSTSLISQLFRMQFPQLLELTVSGYYPFPRNPGFMPKLQRLHLSGNRNPHGLFQMGMLEEVCPSLTHLRISELTAALSFMDELGDAVANNEGTKGPGPFPSKLPSHLQYILVQTAPAAPRYMCGGKRSKAHLISCRLAELAASPKGVIGVQLIVLGCKEEREPRKTMKDEWLDRLSGQPGCWLN